MRVHRLSGMVLVLLAFGSGAAAMADNFGTGGNVFNIEFVPISGATNPTSGIPAGSGFTFTGVNHDYRMGKFEITNDQWNKFQAAYGTVTGSEPGAYDESSLFTGTNVPTNNVGWLEAVQFVNWLNTSTGHHAAYNFTGDIHTSNYTFATWSPAEAVNGTNLYRHKDAFYFLQMETEWVKAAYWNGTALQTYANASPSDLVSGVPDPAKWNYSPSVGFEPWAVGSGSQELNGTYDIMGNVYEWVESPSPYSGGDGENPETRGMRGGMWGSAVGALAVADRGSGSLSAEGAGSGFRVASVPEPGSMILLVCGAIGLLAWAWRRRKRAIRCMILGLAASLPLAVGVAQAVTIETVPVGNPGNTPDTRYATPGYGAVSYAYNIGKYEVTAGQYTDFLNAVAKTDTYGLYSTEMDVTTHPYGCNIKRSGSSGSYSYTVPLDYANRPVNYVSWGDAARFANWMHNGQPTGAQSLSTTEDGAYYLNGATTNAQLLAVTRKGDWKWAITNEDEWYKAAYHDKTSGLAANYFSYPTKSNMLPGYSSVRLSKHYVAAKR